MSDQWTDRLSEYLDGDLAEVENAALEAHLVTSGACRETLAGLRRIVVRARSLEDRPPSRDLWSGVAARIGAGAGPGRRRLSFSVPQLLAAGIALAVLSGGGAWLLHPDPARVAVQPNPAAPGTAPVATVSSTRAVRSYDSAVDDLERILAEGRGRLDSTTVRVLEQNLALIDRAIAQAQRAVAADSANVYLNTHLAETMRRKIDLLRQAAALVSAVS
jgi:anti-sigma factor RsiW